MGQALFGSGRLPVTFYRAPGAARLRGKLRLDAERPAQQALRQVVPAGSYEVRIGGSSADARVRGRFTGRRAVTEPRSAETARCARSGTHGHALGHPGPGRAYLRVMIAQFIIQVLLLPLVLILGDGDNVRGFERLMTVFAVVGTLFFLVTFATTRERIVPAKEQSAAG
ncbi:hypothetical protein NB693_24710 [Pantoea ananatis]|uniref:hypothetical protein n=1 Tax=Pantoea ananas TaxID=553 RepID=UPI00221FAB92|nr:hypothetical protein [Pantoea ananatis]